MIAMNADKQPSPSDLVDPNDFSDEVLRREYPCFGTQFSQLEPLCMKECVLRDRCVRRMGLVTIPRVGAELGMKDFNALSPETIADEVTDHIPDVPPASLIIAIMVARGNPLSQYLPPQAQGDITVEAPKPAPKPTTLAVNLGGEDDTADVAALAVKPKKAKKAKPASTDVLPLLIATTIPLDLGDHTIEPGGVDLSAFTALPAVTGLTPEQVAEHIPLGNVSGNAPYVEVPQLEEESVKKKTKGTTKKPIAKKATPKKAAPAPKAKKGEGVTVTPAKDFEKAWQQERARSAAVGKVKVGKVFTVNVLGHEHKVVYQHGVVLVDGKHKYATLREAKESLVGLVKYPNGKVDCAWSTTRFYGLKSGK